MDFLRLHTFFLGRSREPYRRLAVGLLVVLVLSTALQVGAVLSADPLPWLGRFWFVVLFLAVAGATVNAYVNDGLLLSWAFGIAAVLPVSATLGIADPLLREPTAIDILVMTVRDAAVFGLVAGTTGHLLGLVLGYVFTRPTPLDSSE